MNLKGLNHATMPAGALPQRDVQTNVLSARQRQEARQAAEQLVSSAFVLPMLQQVRQDPLRGDLFHGGPGEDTFGAQLDTILADRIVQRLSQGVSDDPTKPGMGIVNAIYRQITQSAERRTAAPATSGGTSRVKVDLHG